MQPIKSNITANGKCLNPVTTKCVVWDGPDITCLDGTVLCKGQLVETTIYTIATKLCEIYEKIGLDGINTCINGSDDTPFIIDQNSSIKDVFSAIIYNICNLQTKIEILENRSCPEIRGVIPACILSNPVLYNQLLALQGYDDTDKSLPIDVYANFIAKVVCTMLISISSLQTSVSNIQDNIQNLWNTLNNCSNNCNFEVLPTCTNDPILNPNLEPQFIGTAYEWLEAAFCNLQAVVGTPDQITQAIGKECANLDNSDRLSAGGVMSNIGGWINNPTSLSDSLGNMWLTVCDMRQAVQQILNGCCFSLCSNLDFSYDIVWAADGKSVSFSINTPGSATIYNSAAVPPLTPWTAVAGGPIPAWVSTQFPVASQTNVVVTFDDGVGTTATWSLGQKVNQLAVLTTPPSYTFPVGYDNTSNQQTINIQFTYNVVTPSETKTCEINQTDGLPFECCNPYPAPYTWANDISSDTGTDLTIIVKGVVQETGVILQGNPSAIGGVNTLNDTGAFTPASLFLASKWGAIVEITAGPGLGDIRYIISANANQITVNEPWSTIPDATSTYVIQNIYYLFPLTAPDFPCQATTNPLIDFKIQLVEIDSGFQPSNSNTWNIVYQAASVDQTVIYPSGYFIPQGTLIPNKDYAVAVFAQYTCNYSQATVYDYLTPIVGTVIIQYGTPSNPLPTVFTNPVQVQVNPITSNGVSLPSQTATQSTPAQFILNLPTTGSTLFRVAPGQAGFADITGITPKNFAKCGLLYDPWAATAPPANIPNRDIVLGLYRGYDVQLFNLAQNNQYIPVLDFCGIPFKTNSLADPQIRFIYNQPFAFGGPCPSPAVPLCTPAPPTPPCAPGTAGSPIQITIPSTYVPNTIPIVVRYDPTQHPVNTSDDFHTLRILSGSRLRIENNTLSPVSNVFLQVYLDLYVYDPSLAFPSVIQYSPQRIVLFSTGPQTLAPGAIFTATVPSDIIRNCKYGDSVHSVIESSVPLLTQGLVTINSGDFVIKPKSTSQFSCNMPALVTNTYAISSAQLPQLNTAVTTAIRRNRSYNFFITEDIECDFDIYMSIQ